MPRHIIVCEGESEWVYLQRLQSFLDSQPLKEGEFDTPLKLIAPRNAVAQTGRWGPLLKRYQQTLEANKRSPSIIIWTDFDLYHRNDHSCADQYRGKANGIPDFHFSFHNFEDFFALHCDGDQFNSWIEFGQRRGHFRLPLHSEGYLPEIERIFPGYEKRSLPTDFVNRTSLSNLKRNRAHQPPRVNDHGLLEIRAFADFLIEEIERAFPGML